jgi:GNAT superfamily N-acetyltransferase
MDGHICAMVDHRAPKTGLVGFYECIDEKTIRATLFHEAERVLRAQGCTRILGPVQLTIWHSYRLAAEQPADTFFMEPINDDRYLADFAENGFMRKERHVSAQRSDFRTILPHTAHAYAALAQNGLRLHRCTEETFTRCMRDIYDVASMAFRQSDGFIPLSFDEFAYFYEPYRTKTDDAIIEVVYAEDGQERNTIPVGFCFSVPDPLRSGTMILKTIAVLPSHQQHGIGAALLHSLHRAAVERGVHTCIYALIRMGNNVSKLPYPGAKIIREYWTFEKQLSTP